jgi:hypothetical protein
MKPPFTAKGFLIFDSRGIVLPKTRENVRLIAEALNEKWGNGGKVMNANEAKKLTELALENQNKSDAQIVKNWLEHIYREIESACKRGENKISNPFVGVRMLAPTPDQAARIKCLLIEGGYKIETYGERCINGKSELIISW